MEEYGLRVFENKVLRNIAGGITGQEEKSS